jgi:F0F1-type ATP synthase assembly protein I
VRARTRRGPSPTASSRPYAKFSSASPYAGSRPSALAAWETFYVIVGSSAAALTGLQFVVMVLGSEANALSVSTTRAFGTPTIIHFCAALLLSAILTAPWHALGNLAFGLGACGVVGVIYVVMVARRARRQAEYLPVFEDWLWHGVLPLIAYAGVSLRLYAGERYGLVGANGSGKSTFLEILALGPRAEPLTSITALQAGHATSLVAERACES